MARLGFDCLQKFLKLKLTRNANCLSYDLVKIAKPHYWTCFMPLQSTTFIFKKCTFPRESRERNLPSTHPKLSCSQYNTFIPEIK